MARDVIITGIPRAGTSLAAQLLDCEPNSVCLGEPEWHRPNPKITTMQYAEAIQKDFADLREKLLAGIPIPDRRGKNNEAISNYFAPDTNYDIVQFTRDGLTEDFTLGIKHNGPYLAALPELIALNHFEIRAVIRHPLEVMRSWRRLKLPISEGRMPNATAYWPELAAAEKIPSLIQRQVVMLDAMFARIRAGEKNLTLIRYEEVAKKNDSQQSSARTEEDESIRAMLKHYAPNAAHYYSI